MSRQQIVALIIILMAVIITAPFIISGIDWVTNLRPATLAFLRLENPYQLEGTFNPPWLFILLAPLALLPENTGGGILLWLNLITWIVIARQFSNGNMLKVTTILTFPFVVNGLLARNVDFLVMWGLLLPPEFAIFFLAIKPQVGGGVILLLALRAYKENGIKKLLQVFATPTLLIVLSMIAYGPWPLTSGKAIDLSWNASPIKILGWPSIFIGIILFMLALQNKDSRHGINISMAASPFLSPYVGSQSWVAILPALIRTNAIYVVWIILWGWVIFRTLQ
jgi:hypothetical protein